MWLTIGESVHVGILVAHAHQLEGAVGDSSHIVLSLVPAILQHRGVGHKVITQVFQQQGILSDHV